MRHSLFYLFSDRHGGVSAPPYDSLNLGDHVGDDPEAVARNRRILQRRIGGLPIVWMEQVHGDRIVDVKGPTERAGRCDALVTKCPGIALAVMVADCVPILMADTRRGVVAAVHAGRNGTLLDIAPKTVVHMAKRYGCDPRDIEVWMGPAIGVCCYQVSEEIATIVGKSVGEKYVNGRYLDLKSLNRDRLIAAGVLPEHIMISDVCTCCDLDYFSYRRDGVTGRFAGVIALQEV